MKRLAPLFLLAAAAISSGNASAKTLQLFDSPNLAFKGPAGAQALATGDFNGDGNLDVATANLGVGPDNGSVSIYLGNGQGMLLTPRTFPAGNGTIHLAVRDFDDDGFLDVVAFNAESEDASVFRGLGDGSLVSHSLIPLGAIPTWSAAADVNGDNATDIIVATLSGIVMMVADGALGFTLSEPLDYIVPRLATGDVDGDGDIDIVTTEGQGHTYARVLLGHGDGTFELGGGLNDLASGGTGSLRTVSLGDFDGDGGLDLLAAFLDGDLDERAVTFRGQGDGTFATPTMVADAHGGYGRYATFGDINGDGADDVLTLFDGTAWGVGTYLGTPSSAFEPAAQRREAGPIIGDDFNNDGLADAVFTLSDELRPGQSQVSPIRAILHLSTGGVALALSNGDGTLGQTHFQRADGSCEHTGIAIGDLTDDGIPDIVTTSDDSGEMLVWTGLGDGTFEQQSNRYYSSLASDAIVIGDVNRDGHNDVIGWWRTYQSRVEIQFGDGAGGFTRSESYPMEISDTLVEIGDQDGDGWPDVFIIPDRVRYGTPSGELSDPVIYKGGGSQSGNADVDHDGLVDHLDMSGAIWVARGRSPEAVLGYGAGTGRRFAIGDLNGDGGLDLVAVRGPWQKAGCAVSGITVLLNRNVRPASVAVDFDPQRLDVDPQHQPQWITAYIEPQAGESLEQIDVGTIRLNGLVEVAQGEPVVIGDYDNDKVPDMELRFRSSEIVAALGGLGTFNVVATGDFTDEEFAGSASIEVVQDGTTPVLVSIAEATASVDGLRIRWHASTSVGTEWSVWRSEGDGGWMAIDQLPQGPSGFVEYFDSNVQRGTRYGYRLTSENHSGFGIGEVWLTAPLLNLALEGAIPNPTLSDRMAIGFSLPSAAPALLTVVDVAGRHVASRSVGMLGPGRHVIQLGDGGRLPPGLYFVRLAHRDRIIVKRAVVAR